MGYSFISRSSHEAILAATKAAGDAALEASKVSGTAALEAIKASNLASIEVLECELSVLRQTLALSEQSRAQLTQQVIQLSRGVPPAAPVEKERKPREPREADTLDLAMVDPNDTETLMWILKREMPAGKVSGVQLTQSIEKLRNQVKIARAARAEEIRNNPVVLVHDVVGPMMDQPQTKGEAEAVLDGILDEAREIAHKEVFGGK